uniref:ATP synthase subunit a n=1 Tax=Pisione sp. YZ-2018 TaxID=2153337 RepID=A0A343W6I7_9ANNE|nr:ATP synthase F0 subunit 6 [Pisione sp. YZ-2018]
MMADIFSSFDPFTTSLFSVSPLIFWAFTFSSLILIFSSFWLSNSRMSFVLYFPVDLIYNQLSRTFSIHLKGLPVIISALFLLLISLNLMGLLPYIFSYSGHLILTLSFGLPLWLSLIISGASHAPSSFAAGLLPGGAPAWLNPFLVLIESVSISVRFITLSFRLAANITAGHIVLGLMGVYACGAIFSSISSAVLLLLIQAFFLIFELGVGIIQAYIFCLLLTLYSDDHPHE